MFDELFKLLPDNMNPTGQIRAIIAARYISNLSQQGLTDATIALLLNAKGIQTCHGKTFTKCNVAQLRHRIENGCNTAYRLGWEATNA